MLLRTWCRRSRAPLFTRTNPFESKRRMTTSISSTPDFGAHTSGKQATLYTLRNDAGYAASITDYGATLVSMVMPDKDGKCDDCVLGFDDVPSYIRDSPYFGATCGRFANRIAKGKFTLDGEDYQVNSLPPIGAVVTRVVGSSR